MTKVAGLDQLSVINQKVVGEGEVLPQVVLKDGSQVQTGTVATMLHNIELYNAGQRGQIEEELKIAIPTLVKVGLFDLFNLVDARDKLVDKLCIPLSSGTFAENRKCKVDRHPFSIGAITDHGIE